MKQKADFKKLLSKIFKEIECDMQICTGLHWLAWWLEALLGLDHDDSPYEYFIEVKKWDKHKKKAIKQLEKKE